jgi:hypothetical protein
MGRPVLLDLFCGAGGAGMGYHQAGFDVIGVDINPQPRYPFRFVQGDALDVLAGWDLMQPFDAIHASPPCQAYSALRTMPGVGKHPELVDVTRRALERTGVPWVIENVPGAPLRVGLQACAVPVRARPGLDGTGSVRDLVGRLRDARAVLAYRLRGDGIRARLDQPEPRATARRAADRRRLARRHGHRLDEP